MRWPVDASLDPATYGTAKAGKPQRDLTEKRGYHVAPIVLHVADATAVWANWASNGVVPGLHSDDLLLEACQQPLRFGQGQAEIGDIAEIIRPIDLHDVCARCLALSPDFTNRTIQATRHPTQNRRVKCPVALTPPILRQSRDGASKLLM
jgi:hypothetical protein